MPSPGRRVITFLLLFGILAPSSVRADLGSPELDRYRLEEKYRAELREKNYCAYLFYMLGQPPSVPVYSRDRDYLDLLNQYANGKPWEPPAFYTDPDGREFRPVWEDFAKDGLQPKVKYGNSIADHWDLYDPATGRFHYKSARPHRTIVDNGDRRIKAIRINYSDNVEARKAQLDSYENILKKMPKLELWVVYRKTKNDVEKKRLQRRIARMPEGVRRRIKITPIALDPKTQFFEWARDASIAVEAEPGEEPSVLVPAFPNPFKPRPDYRMAIDALQHEGRLGKVDDALFPFSAGNLVTGERHAFVGAEAVNEAMRRFAISHDEALEALSAELGRPVLEIGVPGKFHAMEQPVFDIDMSLSVVRDRNTKKEVVLLASPRPFFEKTLGLPPLETLTPETYRVQLKKKVRDYIQSHYREITEDEKELFDTLIPLPYETLMIRVKQMDFIEQRLREQDYETRFVPDLTLLLQGQIGTALDALGGHVNTLLSGRDAIVPTLGIPILDEPALSQYRALGYRVIPDPSANLLYRYWGGTRCAAQVCRRPR